MSRVEEIKAAIDQLTPQERCELVALLNPVEEDDWDREMKKDAEPGGNCIGSWKRRTRNTNRVRACRSQNPWSEVQSLARILEAVSQSSDRDSKIGLQELFALAK
jgi:hypothetical protein